MHGHQPTPRKRLLRPIPEVGLIPRVRGNGTSIWSRFMPFHGLGSRHKWRMFGHGHMVWEGRVVLGPNHQPRHLVIRVTRLPAPIRPIHRVPIDVDIVPVVDPTDLWLPKD